MTAIATEPVRTFHLPHLTALDGPVPALRPYPKPSRPPPGRGAVPELVRLAELSARLPRRAGGSIEILLAAARPFADGFLPLRPFWVQEAAHRAMSTLRLFIALQRRDRGRPSPRNMFERRLALHLAAELAGLETTSLTRILPCSGPLRETARDLVALFGPSAGQIALDTDVTPLSLPAYRRRALVLLGHELVVTALTHGFEGRSTGRLTLRLQRLGAFRACLQLCDDGIGFTHGVPNPAVSVAGGLADLLEGEIRYFSARGVTVELVFPTGS